MPRSRHRSSLPTTPADGLAPLVQLASRFVLQHPIAAQELFAALVAEGRRAAATPDGERLRRALADSELVRKGRELWERSPLNFLEDSADAVLPAGIRDALLQLATRAGERQSSAGRTRALLRPVDDDEDES